MDLRFGGHVRIQDVYDLQFDPTDEIVFPLKSMYDRANGTLEGLSAPVGAVSDVAPQGLADLGCDDEPPQDDPNAVGVLAGEADESPEPEALPSDIVNGASGSGDDVERQGEGTPAPPPDPVLLRQIADNRAARARGRAAVLGGAPPLPPPARPKAADGEIEPPPHAEQPDEADTPKADAPFVYKHPDLGDITERPANFPACIPWLFPPHWHVASNAFDKMQEATEFRRPPTNNVHPDIFNVTKGAIVRWIFAREKKNSTRIPDIEPLVWYHSGCLRLQWTKN